jgi:hypothetical protein
MDAVWKKKYQHPSVKVVSMQFAPSRSISTVLFVTIMVVECIRRPTTLPPGLS